MHNFPRPQDHILDAVRVAVPGECPACGSASLARYRVLSEGGWWIVVKCQQCLHAVSREPGPLLGAFEPLGAPR